MPPENGQPTQDRRRAPRARVLLRVEYRQGEDFAHDYVTDLGEGGIFIRTDLDLPIGSTVSVSLSFPGLLEPTNASGVVRWRREAGESVSAEQVGVGVELTQWTNEDRERIQSLARRLLGTKMPRDKSTPRSLRVLLVEDNAFVSDLFRHAVRRFQHELGNPENHELVTARTGLEALRLLEGAPPDMVILDHYLPGMTGCSLVRRIRGMRGFEATPILMISVGGSEIRREALDAGATLYMDKPILLTQLLDTLRALTEQVTACH